MTSAIKMAVPTTAGLDLSLEEADSKPMRRRSQEHIAAWRKKVRSFVDNWVFEAVMGCLILANCITIGIEVDQCPPATSPRYTPRPNCPHKNIDQCNIDCPANAMFFGEQLFTVAFVIEFFLRVLAFGWGYYYTMTNMFDAFLVWFTGAFFLWILTPMEVEADILRKFTVFRAARLMRVARVVKNNPKFREMWMLLRGLMDSSRVLLWTAVVINFVTYVFGVFAVITIGDSEAYQQLEGEAWEENGYVQDYFSGLDKTLFTLLQVMTGDSWASVVARPVIKVQPAMWMFFVLFVGIAMMVLLNLITAVIVDSAMEISKQDAEQRLRRIEDERKQQIAHLEKLFDDLDSDGSRTLDEAEFEQALKTDVIMNEFKLLGFDEQDAMNIFMMLDDGEEKLTVTHFCEGLRKMQGEARSQDLLKAEKNVMRQLRKVERKVDCYITAMGMGTIPSGVANGTVSKEFNPNGSLDSVGSVPMVNGNSLARNQGFLDLQSQVNRLEGVVEQLQGTVGQIKENVAMLGRDMGEVKEAALEVVEHQRQLIRQPGRGIQGPVLFPDPGAANALPCWNGCGALPPGPKMPSAQRPPSPSPARPAKGQGQGLGQAEPRAGEYIYQKR